MKSRKVCEPFTVSSDLAFSSPIAVPSPPLSFSTTVTPSSSGSSAASAAYWGRLRTGQSLCSGIVSSAPLASLA